MVLIFLRIRISKFQASLKLSEKTFFCMDSFDKKQFFLTFLLFFLCLCDLSNKSRLKVRALNWSARG